MIKVIIFDVDGVLLKSERKFSVLLAEKYGISLEQTAAFFHGSFQECLIGKADLKETILPYLAKWGWDKGVDAFLDVWFKAEHNINEELIEYIKGLRQRGILCFIATNNEKYRFQYILDKIGFADSFDQTYASAHIGHKKPEQDFFHKIFKDLENINKDEILFWDDDSKNIQGAKDFGIHAEFYSSMEDFKEKMQEYVG